jgi:hypothetical protein
MPTSNRRIATYIPKEIDEKFQIFKQERDVGDSQALILLMSEYFGVSQQVTYSDNSPLVKQVEELSNLLSELKSELATKVGEERISELKSELLSGLKLSSSDSELLSEPVKQLDIGAKVTPTQQKALKPRVKNKPTKLREVADGMSILNTNQLAQRLGKKAGDITSKKYKTKNKVDAFIKWSREEDPEGLGWEFKGDSPLFYKVAHQLEPLA